MVVVTGITVWLLAALSTFGTIVYVFTMGMGDNEVEIARVHMKVLAGGLFPWIFAYAITRVVYGLEVLIEP